MRMRSLPALIFLVASGHGLATQTVRLPASLCAGGDSIFVDDFDASGVIPHDPSSGAGGTYPGDLSRTITVPGIGSQTYYLHVPPSYSPAQTMPLLVVLHGYAGDHASAAAQAAMMRGQWSTAADRYGFVVVAPVGKDSDGSWDLPPPIGATDYDVIGAVKADVQQAYNIESSRVYLWGFSAGGHVAWDLVLNADEYNTPLNQSNLAAFALSAGAMGQLACNPQVSGWCASLVSSVPRKLPINIHIGVSDPLLAFAQYDRAMLLAHGWQQGNTLSYTEFAGGHTYTLPQLDEIGGFLCRFAIQH